MKHLRKYIEGFNSIEKEVKSTHVNNSSLSINNNKIAEITEMFYTLKDVDFNIIDRTFMIEIIPSINFQNIIENINSKFALNLDIDMKFKAFLEKDYFNRVDFEQGIPQEIRGAKLGYNIYLAMCRKFGYISTISGVTPSANRLWYGLVHDKSVFIITNDKATIMIDKNYSDVKKVVDEFYQKYPNSTMDNELKQYLEKDGKI